MQNEVYFATIEILLKKSLTQNPVQFCCSTNHFRIRIFRYPDKAPHFPAPFQLIKDTMPVARAASTSQFIYLIFPFVLC